MGIDRWHRRAPRWAIAVGVVLSLTVEAGGQAPQPGVPPVDTGVEAPDLEPIKSAEAIKSLWSDMRSSYNTQRYAEVCSKLDALRHLEQDISPSRATAAYAYLVCARNRANAGYLEEAERYLTLSVQYGGQRQEHDLVRATLDRFRGIAALKRGEIKEALRLLELASARGQDSAANELVSAELTRYAYEMYGRDDKVRALLALDAALHFYPTNRQAELLRREIWMWDYGAWLVLAVGVFLIALYFVYRQWREVKIRNFSARDF